MSEERTRYKVKCYGSGGLAFDFSRLGKEAMGSVIEAAEGRKTLLCKATNGFYIVNFALVVNTRITEEGDGE